MKIRSLDLLAFGVFTKRQLDFTGAPLVLVYGPNGGGKSTARTAIENALFGITETTTYGFQHRLDQLRIGLGLDDGHGARFDLVRRKGRSRTLSHPDHSLWTEADDEQLHVLCHGMDSTVFAALFGLDHDRLREGAQDLLRSRGELGESLLGAETGVSLGQLLSQLTSAADALWVPKGQKYPLNAALRAYREAHQTVGRTAVRPQVWVDAEAEVARLTAERDLKEAERRTTETRRRELDRLQSALPVLAARDRAVTDLNALPVGEAFTPEQLKAFEEAAATRRDAGAQVEKGQTELNELTGRLEQLPLDQPLLARAAEIRALEHELGRYLRERDDQPLRQRERELKVADALDRLHPYWPDLTLEMLREGLSLRAAEFTTLERLTGEPERFQNSREEIASEEKRLERQARKWTEALKELGQSRDWSPLETVLGAANRDGPVEQELDKASAHLAQLHDTLAPALGRLGCADRSPMAVAALVIPTRDAVSAWLAERQNRAQAAAAGAQAEEDLTAKGEAAERDLQALELVRPVPALTELDAARHERSTAWEALKATWMNGPPPTDAVVTYEAAVGRVDTLAEALWREAERITQHARLQAEREAVGRELSHLREQAESRADSEGAAERAWSAMWAATKLPVPKPTEALAALDAHAKIVEVAPDVAGTERQVRTLTETRDRHRTAVRSVLEAYGVAIPDDVARLAALLDLATEELAKAARAERRQREAEAGLASQSEARAALEDRRAGLASHEAEWQVRWMAALKRLHLPVDGTTVETMSTALHELREAKIVVAAVSELDHRIRGMAEDCEVFATRARELVRAVAPDLSPVAPDEQARQLGERLRDQEKRHAQREELARDVTAKVTGIERAAKEVASAESALSDLAIAVGIAEPGALDVAVGLAHQRAELTDQIAAQERDLLARRTGWTVAEFLEQRAGTDADTLADRIRTLGEELDEQGESLSRTIGDLTRAQGLLEKLNAGGSEAAWAAEAQEEAAADIAELARRYVRLQFAAGLLRVTMQQHRDAHQAWVLERASAHFKTLTADTFRRLDVSEEPGEEPVIVAVRADGDRPSALDEISDGERDQLYLALRLASVERHCASDGPMPVILDDVLVNFDDDRAAAALRVLVELSQTTQVLVFTHHQRVLDLARAVLPAESFAVAALGKPAEAPAA